ncbi:mid1-interacting protein 1-like [Brienomyrus brachyistius]|uniref:mid1-interacting protein 1-like n=1 Tax=Brienomyrus brachyistius TaxID=42636 RepID=UPI0020B2840D|nr:mid1-interacting protein 1-like [Brienomyrus brachyistius]
MMQMNGELSCNKHSLMNVMNRFIAAANNMDETIMVPSVLRDVPVDEPLTQPASNNNEEAAFPDKQRDMYERYLLVKSIRNDMEWGLLRRDLCAGGFVDRTAKRQQEEVCGGSFVDDGADLEGQFHFHLRGLFGVLSKLTVQADHLTNRYKREIGGGNYIR